MNPVAPATPAAQPVQLALGTVQFGLAYGIAGRSEAVPEAEVAAILDSAAACGVSILDTAAAYGDIEQRLATLAGPHPFRFVTKVPALPDELPPAVAAEQALRAAEQSLSRLGGRMSALLVHRAQDLQGERGERLIAKLGPWCRSHGIALGASCYSPSEAASLVKEAGITIAQVPGNAFDQRLAQPSVQQALRDVEIHLRSAFLQGLLLMDVDTAWRRLPDAREPLLQWHEWLRQQGLSQLEGALAIVKGFRCVRAVVVGVDSLAQWQAIAQAWQRAQPIVAPDLGITERTITDPRLWRLQS